MRGRLAADVRTDGVGRTVGRRWRDGFSIATVDISMTRASAQRKSSVTALARFSHIDGAVLISVTVKSFLTSRLPVHSPLYLTHDTLTAPAAASPSDRNP